MLGDDIMKSFTVGINDEGKRLDKYMAKTLDNAGGAIYRALRKKRVKINGRRVTDGSVRLVRGDVIEMYINDELFCVKKEKQPFFKEGELRIIYEDAHIIIMNKKAGVLSQSSGKEESLEEAMRAYLYKKGEFEPDESVSFVPSLCHRIDRNTAGLVIGAKDAESLRILNKKIKDREIKKLYICETEGTPNPTEGEIKGWLKKDEKTRKMQVLSYPEADAVPFRTRYRVIKEGRRALVEAELMSGRTHQIRAGFSHMGCPIVGDVKYGAKKDGGSRYQRLAAYKLVFEFCSGGGALDYLNGKEFVLKEAEKCFG